MNSGSKGVFKNVILIFIAALIITGLPVLFLLINGSPAKLKTNSQPYMLGKAMEETTQKSTADMIIFKDSGLAYDVPEGIDFSGRSYEDGVYDGVADGYCPGLAVEVTITGGLVQLIEVKGNYETPGFFEYIFEEFPKLVIASQSTDIDVVSGATYTSNAYLAAIEDALRKADN